MQKKQAQKRKTAIPASRSCEQSAAMFRHAPPTRLATHTRSSCTLEPLSLDILPRGKQGRDFGIDEKRFLIEANSHYAVKRLQEIGKCRRLA
jgi:hypothetical protein